MGRNRYTWVATAWIVGLIGCPAPKQQAPTSSASAEDADADPIRSGIRKRQGHLTHCYEEALQENPNVQGRIEVEWQVVQGNITQARILSNTTDDADMATCVIRKIESWRFDRSVTDTVVWPFEFRRR